MYRIGTIIRYLVPTSGYGNL
eukprot:SAG11_NODE_16016_length_559_cov_0.943478_1_plen_20_part_10